jgi:PAS domain S-box-containing protein
MHSIKFKLLTFTILVVFATSMAILWISVYQIQKKGARDIEDIRVREMSRVRASIKDQVNFIYSLINAQYRRSSAKHDLVLLIDKIMNSTYEEGQGYFWIYDALDSSRLVIHPFFDRLNGADRRRLLDLIGSVNAVVHEKGENFIESKWPRFADSAFSDSSYPILCYGREFPKLNWIVAAGRYEDDINDIIAGRVARSREEIAIIVRERIILSAIILFICTVGIVVFSNTLTRPINRLVVLTEEITSGKKGYSERIDALSRDEIGRLARSFNRMLGHIQSTMAELEEHGRNYRELVENANSAIIRIDRTGKILFVNEFSQRMFGFGETDVSGMDITGLLKAPSDSAAPLSIKDVLASPDLHLSLEGEIVTSADVRKWMAWSNKPLYDEKGDLKEILCVGSDITARKQAEELAQLQQRKLIQTDKMATLGMLVSGIAHEINNPNNFIILNAESLAQMWNDIRPVLDDHYAIQKDYSLGGLPYGEMREEFPALIRGTAEGAQRIKRIVQSLKDFIRQEPSELNQAVSLEQVVESACLILCNLIKKSTQHFQMVKGCQLPSVKGNFQRLEQVVINLLTNACQATVDPSKPITITLSEAAAGRQVCLTVADGGVGIEPAHMKYIMNPFFTTKRHSGGTGLGLAIAYSIIKDHGGELKIESTPGEGTSAIITLPAA